MLNGLHISKLVDAVEENCDHKIERSLFLPLMTLTQVEDGVLEDVTLANNAEEPQDFEYPSDESRHEDMEYYPTSDHSSDSSDSSDYTESEIDLEELVINGPRQIKKDTSSRNKKKQGAEDVILEDIIMPTQAELYLFRKKKNKKKIKK